jgi:hypothetical protein
MVKVTVNELRIGNWLRGYNFDGSAHKVTGNEIFDAYNDPDDFNAVPVILTSEILDKCGFVKSIDGIVFYTKGDISFEWYGTKLHFTDGCMGIDIYYLHQLQNLYFALTGEELKVEMSEPKAD